MDFCWIRQTLILRVSTPRTLAMVGQLLSSMPSTGSIELLDGRNRLSSRVTCCLCWRRCTSSRWCCAWLCLLDQCTCRIWSFSFWFYSAFHISSSNIPLAYSWHVHGNTYDFLQASTFLGILRLMVLSLLFTYVAALDAAYGYFPGEIHQGCQRAHMERAFNRETHRNILLFGGCRLC